MQGALLHEKLPGCIAGITADSFRGRQTAWDVFQDFRETKVTDERVPAVINQGILLHRSGKKWAG